MHRQGIPEISCGCNQRGGNCHSIPPLCALELVSVLLVRNEDNGQGQESWAVLSHTRTPFVLWSLKIVQRFVFKKQHFELDTIIPNNQLWQDRMWSVRRFLRRLPVIIRATFLWTIWSGLTIRSPGHHRKAARCGSSIESWQPNIPSIISSYKSRCLIRPRVSLDTCTLKYVACICIIYNYHYWYL